MSTIIYGFNTQGITIEWYYRGERKKMSNNTGEKKGTIKFSNPKKITIFKDDAVKWPKPIKITVHPLDKVYIEAGKHCTYNYENGWWNIFADDNVNHFYFHIGATGVIDPCNNKWKMILGGVGGAMIGGGVATWRVLGMPLLGKVVALVGVIILAVLAVKKFCAGDPGATVTIGEP